MSNLTYSSAWVRSNKEIEALLEYEKPVEPSFEPKDKDTTFSHIAVLYIRYINLYKVVEVAYDQIAHPQKKRAIKTLLDTLIGRVLELKQKLSATKDADYINFEQVLLDLKLVPKDIEIPVPRFVRAGKETQKPSYTQLLENSAKTFQFGNEPRPGDEITFQEAIRIVQANERGRQGKIRAKFMADLKTQTAQADDLGETEGGLNVEQAALHIQRAYRGHAARKKRYSETKKDLSFLGIGIDLNDKGLHEEEIETPSSIDQANAVRRKELQQTYESEYQQALVAFKEKITQVEGPDIREGLLDSFRQWYLDYRRTKGKFPDFPPDEEWFQSEFNFIKYNTKLAELELAQNEDKNAKAADKKGDAKKGGKKGESVDNLQVVEQISPVIKSLQSCLHTFNDVWKHRDESQNFFQKHDSEIIKAQKRQEVEAEIKVQILDILKEELKNLKLAAEKDGGKSKKKEKGSAKKDKKGDKKKEKEVIPVEPMLEELLQAAVVQKSVDMKIHDFKGEIRITQTDVPGSYSLGDVRRLIIESCILPLSFENKDDAVKSPCSVFLFGAKGTGKRMLVNIVASETGATFYNISPRVLGQTGNATKILSTVFKAARLTAPSVIYMQDAELVFAKKLPKDEPFDARKLKKDLTKNLKSLKPSERVLFIGCSVKPWEADAKVLLSTYDKFIYVPKPNYGSRGDLWSDAIRKYGGVISPFLNTTTLARLAENCTGGDIYYVCERVLTTRRLKAMRVKPLRDVDFLKPLATLAPINPEEETNMKETVQKLLGPKAAPEAQ